MLDNTFGINGTVNISLENTPVVVGPSGQMCLNANNRIIYGIHQEGILNSNIAIYRFLENKRIAKIDISTFPQGAYVVELRTENSTILGKFIKKR
jgi:hypothetical protein